MIEDLRLEGSLPIDPLTERLPRSGQLPSISRARPLRRSTAAEWMSGAQHKTPKAVGFSRLKLSRSEEHTSELQSLMRISYAVFCLKKKTTYITSCTYNNYVNY